jgi:hypothetical protein
MTAAGIARYDPAKHHRRSIRQPGHDYAAGGTYFVTINTAECRKRFGSIERQGTTGVRLFCVSTCVTKL